MTFKHQSISIVIPNYNGCDLLEDTIRHAMNALVTSQIDDYEIIVSDDASTDKSFAVMETLFPELKFIQSKVNTGFSGNVNRGINHATKDLICLLNSDLHLTKEYFKAQLPLFDNERTFGVMGLIKEQNTFIDQDGAKYPNIEALKIKSNKNIVAGNKVLPTLFLSGANALIRTKYLKEIGGLNEIFNPYYAEDVDLGIRAWRLGWCLFFQPESVCFHAQSTSIKKLPEEQVRIIAKRNKHFLHFLHLAPVYHWVYVGQISFNALVHLACGKRTHFKALLLFFKQLPALKKDRLDFLKTPSNARIESLLQVKERIKAMLDEIGCTTITS